GWARVNSSAGTLTGGDIFSILAVIGRTKVGGSGNGAGDRAAQGISFCLAGGRAFPPAVDAGILLSPGSGERQSASELGTFSLRGLSCMRAVRSAACSRWDTASWMS